MPHNPDALRVGSYKSWANTPDRTKRTDAGRKAGPGSIEWHEKRLDPIRFADATPDQRRQAAEAARKAWYLALSVKSAATRRGEPPPNSPAARNAKVRAKRAEAQRQRVAEWAEQVERARANRGDS